LQPYDFAADDLANGVQKSAFGQKRTVVLKNLGLVVAITVANASINPTSAGHYQIAVLNLEIQIDNFNP